MNKYFDENIKVLDLITKYPKILDYLVSLGFKPLLNPAARQTVAKVQVYKKKKNFLKSLMSMIKL